MLEKKGLVMSAEKGSHFRAKTSYNIFIKIKKIKNVFFFGTIFFLWYAPINLKTKGHKVF